MKNFEHGGNIKEFAKKCQCKQSEVIDLSSNINFLKPKINIDFNTLDISSYPVYDKLYESIALNYNIKASQVELFNGGSSAIFRLFEILNIKTCALYAPIYLEYKKAAQLFCENIILINRLENMNKEVPLNSLVVFVNPSTPDGKFYEIKKYLKYWKRRGCVVLVDESFLDFTQEKSALRYLNDFDNLYVLKSMTKIYASASIRIGTIISSKKNIKKLRKKEPLWKLSHFDSIYLQKAMKDKNLIFKTKIKTKANRHFLIKTLKKSSFIKCVYKSEANYCLVKLKNIKANELQQYLAEYKIMIRNCSNFDFLDDTYVRIAIKSRKSIKALNHALCEIEEKLCT